jgi:hypothetical protein
MQARQLADQRMRLLLNLAIQHRVLKFSLYAGRKYAGGVLIKFFGDILVISGLYC